ncbi:MAG TPA: lipocalin-like domain-containing protein [Steroidobacteraceae bacterium]|nr:lipocalin-like domain-containing protein [Steroidobacteraceae bacterium]
MRCRRATAIAAAAMALAGHGARAQPPSYAQALAPEPLAFPRDAGPHPDFRQEWWYLTGNLDSTGGERFGFELTFFRFALAPTAPAAATRSFRSAATGSRWRTRQIYLGHFAVTDVARQRFRFAVKLSRGALGLAGARADPFTVWLGNWRMGTAPAEGAASMKPGAKDGPWRLQASEPGYVLSLTARPLLAPVPNGDQGLSRKSAEPGDATYYYSIPRIFVQGTLVRDGRPLQVRGLAWLDREWGSGSLGPQETGWDWFGLQLEDGSSLMFYALRDRGGTEDPCSAGTWVDADGRARPLARSSVRIEVLGHWTDRSGSSYPSRWRLRAPALGLDLTVNPVLADQELVTSPRYWEGAVDISGTRAGRPVGGRGYVELVGYAGTSVGPAGIR